MQVWEKRSQQWERERLARESLMQDVIATRRLQILAKRVLLPPAGLFSSFSSSLLNLSPFFLSFFPPPLLLFFYLFLYFHPKSPSVGASALLFCLFLLSLGCHRKILKACPSFLFLFRMQKRHLRASRRRPSLRAYN